MRSLVLSLVLLFPSLTPSSYAHTSGDIFAGQLLRREVLRLSFEKRAEFFLEEELEPTDFKDFINLNLSAGIGAQGFLLFGHFAANGTRLTSRGRAGLSGLAAINLAASVYLFQLMPGQTDLTPENPYWAGTSQGGAAFGLILPPILAIRNTWQINFLKKHFLWLQPLVLPAAASSLYRAGENFSAGRNEVGKHVQLTPDQFQPLRKKEIPRRILEDRIYVLGAHSGTKVAILKEHMNNHPSDWLEMLPHALDPDGDQIVEDDVIINFKARCESTEKFFQALSELDLDQEPPLPNDFLAQERKIYQEFIQDRIQSYEERKEKLSSAKRARRILNQVHLLVGAI